IQNTLQFIASHYLLWSIMVLLLEVIDLTSAHKLWIRRFNQFTQNALKERANSVHIIQKDMTRLYLLLPPLTLIFMPVVTEVFGEVY
ncbi:MAG TPA: hypothetical protein PL048_20685, partial [Leptospiraceae bacterium]|nr:hypothetical protein [Leptospiraceae bacterium]